MTLFVIFFFFNDTATTEIYTLSLHDALPISADGGGLAGGQPVEPAGPPACRRAARGLAGPDAAVAHRRGRAGPGLVRQGAAGPWCRAAAARRVRRDRKSVV